MSIVFSTKNLLLYFFLIFLENFCNVKAPQSTLQIFKRIVLLDCLNFLFNADENQKKGRTLFFKIMIITKFRLFYFCNFPLFVNRFSKQPYFGFDIDNLVPGRMGIKLGKQFIVKGIFFIK